MTIDEAKEGEIRRLHFAERWKVGTIGTQLGYTLRRPPHRADLASSPRSPP